MIGTTSAAPDDLGVYVEAAGDGTTRLTVAAAELRGALAAFRASDGRAAFLADVPEVDLDLSFLARRWDRLARWLAAVAQAFATADTDDDRTLSDLDLGRRVGRFVAGEVDAMRRDGRLILDTGVGHDHVAVAEQGGRLVVMVNDRVHSFAVKAGEVLLRLGSGHDVLRPAPDGATMPRRLVVDGGSGRDHLDGAGPGAVLRGGAGDDVLRGGGGDDRLVGGDGADRLVGGGGDDRLLGGAGGDVIDGDGGADRVTAGAGDDLVYGGTGDDRVDGGAGRDHLDGGSGVDHVSGSEGDDIVSGGEGHDTLAGSSGADVVLAGPGHDLVTGGTGGDRLHVEGDDVAPEPGGTVLAHRVDLALVDAIVIDPPDGAFAERVRSDLVTLASTETGAALLASLQGHTITVVPDLGDQDATRTDAYDPSTDTVQYRLSDDHPGFVPVGRESLHRGPSYSPLVALHHELVHAAHDVNGARVPGEYRGPDREQLDRDRDGRITGDDWPVSNEERATVGLPIDHDEDPSTPDLPAEDVHDGVTITENDLRHELGLPIRERY